MKKSNISQEQKGLIMNLVINTRIKYRKVADYTNVTVEEVFEIIEEYCEQNGYERLERKNDSIIFIDKNGEREEHKTEKTSQKGNLITARIIKQWTEVNGRKPRQSIEGIKKAEEIKELSGEEKKELRLGQFLNVIKAKVVKKYDNKNIEEIEDEVDRETVRIIREVESKYSIRKNLLDAREIQEWVRKNGRLPKSRIRPVIKHGIIQELSLKQQEELRIGRNLNIIRKQMNDIYQDKKIEEIENEAHREIVSIIRELDSQFQTITKVSKKELSKQILTLAETKNATQEQLKIIADCYGVDLREEKNASEYEER